MGHNHDKTHGDVATLPKTRVREPRMYQVILLNDDYTTMEFVVAVLQKYFHKSLEEANRVMLSVHQKGKGVCGIYTYDIAATKVVQVTEFARQSEMPLRCVMEGL